MRLQLEILRYCTLFWLDVKFEHYNKALCLYFIPPFEQFTTIFFSEYQQDFSLIFIWYTFFYYSL